MMKTIYTTVTKLRNQDPEAATVRQLAEHAPRDWDSVDPATRDALSAQLLADINERCERLNRKGWRTLEVSTTLFVAVMAAACYLLFTMDFSINAAIMLQTGPLIVAWLVNEKAWSMLRTERRLQRKTYALRWRSFGDALDLMDEPAALAAIRNHFDQQHPDPLAAPSWWLSEKHLAAAVGIPVLRDRCTLQEIEVAIGLSSNHPGTLEHVATLAKAVCR